MKKTIQVILLLLSFNSFSQKDEYFDPKPLKEWNQNEKAYYKNLKELTSYIYKKEESKISKEYIYKKYILFDYVSKDTLKERKEKRLKNFDTLFNKFKIYIDSVGIKNLDAKPLRFYTKNKIYQPFEKEGLKNLKQDVFVFYNKSNPENALGTLWFDPKTNKLISWVLINQGGNYYYLTFDLL